jgi:hypothetical protein
MRFRRGVGGLLGGAIALRHCGHSGEDDASHLHKPLRTHDDKTRCCATHAKAGGFPKS